MADGFTAGTSEGGWTRRRGAVGVVVDGVENPQGTKEEQRELDVSRGRQEETMMNGSTPWLALVPRAFPRTYSTRNRKGDGREEWQSRRADPRRLCTIHFSVDASDHCRPPRGAAQGIFRPMVRRSRYVPFVPSVSPPQAPQGPQEAKNPGGTCDCVSSSCRPAQTRLFFLLTFSTPCLVWDLCFFLAFHHSLCPVV